MLLRTTITQSYNGKLSKENNGQSLCSWPIHVTSHEFPHEPLVDCCTFTLFVHAWKPN